MLGYFTHNKEFYLDLDTLLTLRHSIHTGTALTPRHSTYTEAIYPKWDTLLMLGHYTHTWILHSQWGTLPTIGHSTHTGTIYSDWDTLFTFLILISLWVNSTNNWMLYLNRDTLLRETLHTLGCSTYNRTLCSHYKTNHTVTLYSCLDIPLTMGNLTNTKAL